ncbi:hypothetical protein HGRIS_001707 [Hohenbuehelia grisea]|uniref:Uncharacterized protein n=1 Tax=Hohenbuehelia grisea TaxID=104357 RepID=A0ABR3JJZ3_9AGAR
MEPLSLSSSILACMETARKIKGALSMLPHLKSDLQNLKNEVDRGIADIDQMFGNSHLMAVSGELRVSLDHLRSELILALECVLQILPKRSNGFFSATKFNIATRLRCKTVMAKVALVEKKILASRMRFVVLSTMRTEHRVLYLRHEQRERLEHLENLVSDLLLRSYDCIRQRSWVTNSALSAIDYQFLCRQIFKITSTLDAHKQTWIGTLEAPCGVHLEPSTPIGDANALVKSQLFVGTLIRSIHAVRMLNHPSQSVSVQDCAFALFNLADNLDDLGLESDAHILIGFVVLLAALPVYALDLADAGRHDEALDCSRQALILHRCRSQGNEDLRQFPLVSWVASGEADIVYSSEREFTMPSLAAEDVVSCLWSVAVSLASFGRYSEAHVAGRDALTGYEAVLTVLRRPQSSDILIRMQKQLSTWVPMLKTPTMRRQPRRQKQKLNRNASDKYHDAQSWQT